MQRRTNYDSIDEIEGIKARRFNWNRSSNPTTFQTVDGRVGILTARVWLLVHNAVENDQGTTLVDPACLSRVYVQNSETDYST